MQNLGHTHDAIREARWSSNLHYNLAMLLEIFNTTGGVS